MAVAFLFTDADRRCMVEDRLDHFFFVRFVADGRQQNAGSILFHLDGGVEEVSSACAHDLFHGVAEFFAAHIVDVGVELIDAIFSFFLG